MPVGLHDRLHARDIAVMIGAPDIDQEIVAPLQLVAMIGDVGRQVGTLAVLLTDDAVFLIAEV